MRKILFSSAVFAAILAGQAYAADLPSTKTAPAYYAPLPPAFTWTGFYVGVNGGYGGDAFNYPVSVSVPGVGAGSGSARISSSGFLGGGQFGYNYQFSGPFVVGIEADFEGADIEGKVSANGAYAGTPINLSGGSKLDYFGTVRGRLGYAVLDRALLYVAGGFAYGGVNSSVNAAAGGNGSIGVSKNTTADGWTVGGGLEYALTNAWTFRTEYLYADLGKATLYNGDVLGAHAYLGVKTTENIVRAGVNYKFGALEAVPILAKY